MSDADIAAIGRDLARALTQRAKSRSAEDGKLVLQLQTALCAEVFREGENVIDGNAKSELTLPPN